MVIQGDVDLSKNSRIASYPGSQYKKSEKIRASFRHSGPLEYGAENARNGKGLRSRAAGATPPIEFVPAARIWLTATTVRPQDSPDHRGSKVRQQLNCRTILKRRGFAGRSWRS